MITSREAIPRIIAMMKRCNGDKCQHNYDCAKCYDAAEIACSLIAHSHTGYEIDDIKCDCGNVIGQVVSGEILIQDERYCNKCGKPIDWEEAKRKVLKENTL